MRLDWQVTKSRDLITRQRSLTFELDYPENEEDMQPRHRWGGGGGSGGVI